MNPYPLASPFSPSEMFMIIDKAMVNIFAHVDFLLDHFGNQLLIKRMQGPDVWTSTVKSGLELTCLMAVPTYWWVEFF